jgi:hypothetical protein
MAEVGRAHLVRAAGFKDLPTLAEAVDRELEHIGSRAETGQITIVKIMPKNSEGRIGDRKLFIDETGQLGTRGLRYKLYRFEDGWYREAALTKLR